MTAFQKQLSQVVYIITIYSGLRLVDIRIQDAQDYISVIRHASFGGRRGAYMLNPSDIGHVGYKIRVWSVPSDVL